MCYFLDNKVVFWWNFRPTLLSTQLCYPMFDNKIFFLLSRNIFVIPWWITKIFFFRYSLNFVIPWWITKFFLGLLSTQLCYPLVDNKKNFFLLSNELCYPLSNNKTCYFISEPMWVLFSKWITKQNFVFIFVFSIVFKME